MSNDSKLITHFLHAELESIRTSKHSCVEMQKSSYHLTIHPFHIRDISHSIKEILNNGVSKYNKEFGGILLGYENVVVCGSYASLSDDSPFMHTQIEADFYLFRPIVGETLIGVVNKKSDQHLGCLVHQWFNVSLPKPHDVDEWSGHNVDIGQRITFRITYTDLEARLPFIKGELIDEEISSPKKSKKRKKHVECAEDVIAELKGKYFAKLNDLKQFQMPDCSDSEAPKKEKKRKKRRDPSLLDGTLSDLSLHAVFAESPPKLSNSISKSNLDVFDSIVLPPDSDMDEILKDVKLPISKKSKKRKRSHSENA